jgi:PhnB protein
MKLYPYLSFKGNCEEALDFYKDALGGHLVQIGRYGESPMPSKEEDKNKIIHARLQFGDALLMASDALNEDKFSRSSDISLSVECETEQQLDRVFSEISKGGTVSMPLADQFWGARFGMLTDKFGVSWMFNCEKKKEQSGQGETLDIV